MNADANHRRIVLVVRNLPRLRHGCVPTHDFDSSGGTIGSFATDWILNDDIDGIASTHCEIRFDEGDFCVVDRSGRTRINSSDMAMGRGRIARLSDGDIVHIGRCDISVRLHETDASFSDPLPSHSLDRWLAREQLAWPLAASERAEAEDPGRDPLLMLQRSSARTFPMPAKSLWSDSTHYGRSPSPSTCADLADSRFEAVSGSPSIESVGSIPAAPSVTPASKRADDADWPSSL